MTFNARTKSTLLTSEGQLRNKNIIQYNRSMKYLQQHYFTENHLQESSSISIFTDFVVTQATSVIGPMMQVNRFTFAK